MEIMVWYSDMIGKLGWISKILKIKMISFGCFCWPPDVATSLEWWELDRGNCPRNGRTFQVVESWWNWSSYIYIYFTYDITIFTSQKLDMIGICTLSYSIDVETYHFNSPWLPHLTFFVEQMPGAERLHHPHPAGHSATISTRRGMERLNVYI